MHSSPSTSRTRRGARPALLAIALTCSWTLGVSVVADVRAEAQAAPVERAGFDLGRPEIAAFIARMVSRDNFTTGDLTAVLGAAHARPELVPAMTRPAEKVLDWWQYRDRYVTASRIAGGIEFWQAHAPLLDEVAATHGIPPEYLVAILGIETNYGQITGTYREVDTLMTLAFDYPARDAYFRTELRQFLLLARDLGRDPLSMKGSYGGALGVPQLMPSSYRRFAASAPELQKADLWTDWSAILSSIAGFLEQRGWERGGPVLLPARIRGNHEATVTGGLTPNETLAALKSRGVRIEAKLPATTEAVLIRAVLKEGAEYRVGFRNFRVISRYNPRTNYTMAVCDLATTLKERHAQPPLSAPKAAGSGG